MKRAFRVFALWLGLAGAAHAQAAVPPDDTMADQPSPSDFVKRSESGLSFLGNPLRVSGVNLDWAGLHSDTGHAADARYPTAFELGDAMATVQEMGGAVIRVLSAGASAGCAMCIAPTRGQFNEAALLRVDLLLKRAHDAGLKVIIPLAGSGAGCSASREADMSRDTPCIFAGWHGKTSEAFFTDPEVKADFRHFVISLVQRMNTLTLLPYAEDPTIFAWENCDRCGAGLPAQVLASWTEELGAAIKSVDKRHIYENGAFAGRLAPNAPNAVPPNLIALPSVDMLGDAITPAAPDASTPPADMEAAADAVTKAGRIYFIDSYGWTPKDWASPEDMEAFLNRIVRHRAVAGALVTDLQGHADQGGYMPVSPGSGPESVLYYPGTNTAVADARAMQARARAVRRFDFRMADLPIPAFSLVAPPQILHVDQGRIVWRGAAGATNYAVERSPDPHVDGTWTILCTQCATDDTVPWADPAPPKTPAWYRLTPYNANGHEGLPSEPAQSK